MDMRKKEDREIFKKSLGNIDDLIESHYIDHIEQLIEMVNENEKLKSNCGVITMESHEIKNQLEELLFNYFELGFLDGMKMGMPDAANRVLSKIRQLLHPVIDENKRLKEQIKFANNALERMSDNAKELGLDY